MKKKARIKKVTGDVILNIIASSFPTLLLQLFILPYLSAVVANEEYYGSIISLISIFSLFSGAFGAPLNNTRLLLDEKYRKENLEGDFPLLVYSSATISFLLTFISVIFYQRQTSIINALLIATVTTLAVLCNYYLVSFRLQLNYKKILVNSIVQSIGYLFGCWLFLVTKHWELIYISGYGLSLIYILGNSRLKQESFQRTALFRSTCYHLVILVASSFLANTLIYIDRLFLYPLLGGTAVTTYYVSTLIGKSTAMAISPVSGVMLSYFSKMETIKRKHIVYIFFLALGLGTLGYFVCILIAPYFLRLIYPDVVEMAMRYLYLNTATAIIDVLSTVINPIVLKFKSVNWQITIYLLNITTYIVLVIPLAKHYGLMGFCIGGFIATIIKTAMLFVLALQEGK